MHPKRYLELLKKSILNEIYLENEARFLYIFSQLAMGQPVDAAVVREIGTRLPAMVQKILRARQQGTPWWRVQVERPDGTLQTINLRNVCEFSHSMIGRKRLDNIEACLDLIRNENIPGHLVETGVWRGGACIFMRGYLEAWEMTGRRVFVCDSFEGLPVPSHPKDAGYDFSKEKMPILAISLEEVQENFRRYDLLDDRVVFVKGWFRDTLPKLPVDQIALLRLDGDLYESTMDAFNALYDKVVPGGFIIVDDYGDFEPCRRATEEFRLKRGITDPIERIDWTGVFWRKGGQPPAVRHFDSSLARRNLHEIQTASHRYTWRDILMWKNPFDFANYWRLVWQYKPRSIIEIGSKFGGSALWLAEMITLYGIDGQVISIDITPPQGISHPKVEFLYGDARNLAPALPAEKLAALPHPWLVIEDSSHVASHCLSAIEYLDGFMEPGDLLVVEDGIVADLGIAQKFDGGPNRAIQQFIAQRQNKYRLLTEYCDFWGKNVTWNPNGYWLKIDR
ncbi:MAG: class I SAM-dependent methyltransferase [Hydrogenophilus sp.]|nr:class I SAM-dependent methyltransferase [Hydrogenophilus sp.]